MYIPLIIGSFAFNGQIRARRRVYSDIVLPDEYGEVHSVWIEVKRANADITAYELLNVFGPLVNARPFNVITNPRRTITGDQHPTLDDHLVFKARLREVKFNAAWPTLFDLIVDDVRSFVHMMNPDIIREALPPKHRNGAPL